MTPTVTEAHSRSVPTGWTDTSVLGSAGGSLGSVGSVGPCGSVGSVGSCRVGGFVGSVRLVGGGFGWVAGGFGWAGGCCAPVTAVAFVVLLLLLLRRLVPDVLSPLAGIPRPAPRQEPRRVGDSGAVGRRQGVGISASCTIGIATPAAISSRIWSMAAKPAVAALLAEGPLGRRSDGRRRVDARQGQRWRLDADHDGRRGRDTHGLAVAIDAAGLDRTTSLLRPRSGKGSPSGP